MPFPWLAVAQGAAKIGQQIIDYRMGQKQWRRERDESRYAADLAYGREMELLKYQLDYNSPAAQMQRFKDAGLNPNLIYGQGSPGNMQSAPPVPQHKAPASPQISFEAPMIANMAADLKLKQAQTDLLGAKTDESGWKSDLLVIQGQIARNNPYLSEGYVDSIVSQMKSVADMKKQERDYNLDFRVGDGNGQAAGIAKMQKQYDLLLQKWRLGEKDMKVKAEIIQSKEFQNDLQEIQRNWMRDGEITPEVIKQFLFMFLQSLMR